MSVVALFIEFIKNMYSLHNLSNYFMAFSFSIGYEEEANFKLLHTRFDNSFHVHTADVLKN